MLSPKKILQKAIRATAFFGLLNRMPDKPYLKLYYFSRLGKFPNLNTPVTFNEKLQWLKMNDRNPVYPSLVDKYEAKKIIAEKLGEEYIIPTLGVWESVDDIDFDSLPERFVLKCTHDSGSIVVCRDKSKLDIGQAKKKLGEALKTNYFNLSREWPYKSVKPRIIAEQYIENEDGSALRDYKFHCFNGKPELILVCSDRFGAGDMKDDFFDAQWNHLPLYRPGHPNADCTPLPPVHLAKMLAFSEKLSENIPFVRCDFYEIGGKIFFGELTFYPASGMAPFVPGEWDKKLGDRVSLDLAYGK